MIKYNLILWIFLYPFLLFLLIIKLNYIKIFFIFLLIWFLYFFIIYFYWFWNIDLQKINSFKDFIWIFNVIWIEIFFKASLLSSFVFWFSWLISSFLYHKYFREDYYYLNYLIFPILFLVFKYICFQFLFWASYLLEVSIVFPSFLSFINLTFQHLFIFIFSIIFFDIFFWKRYKILFFMLYFIFFLFLLNFQIWKKIFINEKKEKIKIAMVQHNSFESNDKNVFSYDDQLKYIIDYTKQSANNWAKVVIWPESTYYNIYPSKFEEVKKSLNNLSQELDIVIVFWAVWIIDWKREVYSSAFVIDPEKWIMNPYNAQELYPRENKYSFKKWENWIVFETKYGNFFILICFEALIRNISNTYLENINNIDYMVVISNNKFLWDSKVMDTLVWNYIVESSRLWIDLFSSSNTWPTTHLSNIGKIIDKLDYNINWILYSEIYLK